MTRSSLKSSEKEKQQVTDELMMPAGEFGGLVIAALLLLVGFWGTSGLAHSVFPTNASNHRLLMRFSWEKRSPLMTQVKAIASLSHLPSGRYAPVTTEATASADGDAEETASPMNRSQAEEGRKVGGRAKVEKATAGHAAVSSGGFIAARICRKITL